MRVVVVTPYMSVEVAPLATKADADSTLVKTDLDDILRRENVAVLPSLDEPPSQARQQWKYTQQLLADAKRNISETARRLKIARRTLQQQVQKEPPKS